MELLSPFFLGIISAILSFLIMRATGFNIRGIIVAVPIVMILLPFILLTIQAPTLSSETITQSLTAYLTNFVNFLPSLLIGQIGGAIVGLFIRPNN